MAWTEPQRAAINARSQNLLVSAAAGSGKTAVLTERIVSLVKEGARVDDLLVVTFTNAAASEMRTRIMMALHDAASEGDRHLATQALRVEHGDITTLHGFCSQICHTYFQKAGLDPNFRIGDTAECTLLQSAAMVNILTACFETPSPAFAQAAAWLSQEQLQDTIQQLHRFLMSRPDPWEWLEESVTAHDIAPEALRLSPWMDCMLSALASTAEVAVHAFKQELTFAKEAGVYLSLAEADMTLATSYHEAARLGYDCLMALGKPAFATKPRANKKAEDFDEAIEERFGALRDAAKRQLNKVYDTCKAFSQLESLAEDEKDCMGALAGLAQATRAYHTEYARLKEEKNLLDYSDLEHFALQALRDEDVTSSVRAKYRYVFVDEYQDSSLLQEALLAQVTRGDNLFMVGDVKQSIYRFRLAEPSLFLGKLHAFETLQNAPNRKISLNANFRSLPTLLYGINHVFERVFCGERMDLTYEAEEQLIPGKESYASQGAKIEMHVIKDTEDSDDENAAAFELSPESRESIRQEANVIADRIIELQHLPSEPYSFRDIAILMRTVRGKAAQVIEVLRERGIPAWSDLGEDALDRCEVQAIVAVLEVIDNLRQDIPLLAALRGPALGLSDENLAVIRIAQPEGAFAEAVLAYAEKDDPLAEALRHFVERVRGWALDAQVIPLDTLIRQIYDETGHYAQCGAQPDEDIRQANLRMLAEHAGSFQRAQSGSLGAFLRYLKRIKERGDGGLAAKDISERDNVVRVMSIHKSKGLQFPVVFVAGLGRQLRGGDSKQLLQMHATLGLGLRHINPKLRTKHVTLSQQAIAEKQRQESYAEEARILYVAMTRAENRLILTGSTKTYDEAVWQPENRMPPAHAKSMLDWVMPSALESEHWALSLHTPQPLAQRPFSFGQADHLARELRGLPAPDRSSEASIALSWAYPETTREPIKQSVSAVVRAEAKLGERDENAFTALADLPKRPLFMEQKGLSASERGDAVHTFLRAVPLDAKDLPEICRILVHKGMLSEEQAKSLPMRKLEHALQSEVWARMRKATVLHREWPFNLRVDREGQPALLQGVIDCCFIEDDQWVLVDYKTDRADNVDDILAHYRPQLSHYAQALTAITGIPVKERILYLLSHQSGYAI